MEFDGIYKTQSSIGNTIMNINDHKTVFYNDFTLNYCNISYDDIYLNYAQFSTRDEIKILPDSRNATDAICSIMNSSVEESKLIFKFK